MCHLVSSAQNGRLAREAQTYGTHDARLARSVGTHNHVQVWSRIHNRMIVGSGRENVSE